MAKVNEVLKAETGTPRVTSTMGGAKLTLEGSDLADTVEEALSDYSDGYKATSVLSVGATDTNMLLRSNETWGYCLTKKDQVEDDKVGAACHLVRGDVGANGDKTVKKLGKHG